MTFGDVMKGMQILRRYIGDDEYVVCAIHDQLFVGSSDLPLTDDERAQMERLGWFISKESWSCYT